MQRTPTPAFLSGRQARMGSWQPKGCQIPATPARTCGDPAAAGRESHGVNVPGGLETSQPVHGGLREGIVGRGTSRIGTGNFASALQSLQQLSQTNPATETDATLSSLDSDACNNRTALTSEATPSFSTLPAAGSRQAARPSESKVAANRPPPALADSCTTDSASAL